MKRGVVDPYHQIVVNTYVRRSRLTYKEYFDQAQTRPLADYFFEKIYTLEGKAERDELAMKTYNRFKGMLSEKSRGRIENLLLLNEVTDKLDQQMADYLRDNKKLIVEHDGIKHIDLKKLPQIYKKCNRFEDRVEQLKLVVHNLESFFELSKHPLAGVVMRPVSLAARTVGFTSLYKVFEEGYNATKPVSKEVFFEFTQYVRGHETQFLEKAYKKHIHLL
ncbi:MAG: hypothetical protein J0L53_06790 [Spirochaetes bacterium]|nr:hypothetical protein [Spirochaetota bacterium]MBX3722558.1 hypothetical protein [Turneriella sp.]